MLKPNNLIHPARLNMDSLVEALSNLDPPGASGNASNNAPDNETVQLMVVTLKTQGRQIFSSIMNPASVSDNWNL